MDELSERLSKLMPEGKMPAEDNEETLMALDFVVLRLAAVAKATYIEEPNVAKLCLALLTEENMPKSSVEVGVGGGLISAPPHPHTRHSRKPHCRASRALLRCSLRRWHGSSTNWMSKSRARWGMGGRGQLFVHGI